MSEQNTVSAKERIKQVFLSLLGEKEYSKITVSAVIKAAEVNRSTFYRNFLDIFDLYEQVCNDVVEMIDNEISAGAEKNGDGALSWQQLYDGFLNTLLKYKDYIFLLSGVNGNVKILKNIRKIWNDNFNRLAKNFPAFHESRKSIINMTADAAILAAFCLSSDKYSVVDSKQEDIKIDYTFDFSKSIEENVAIFCGLYYKDKSELHSKLCAAAVKIILKNETSVFSVGDLTEAAGVSRTEFYLCYKNYLHFIKEIHNAFAVFLSNTVYTVAVNPFMSFETAEFYERDSMAFREALLQNIDHMTFLSFVKDVNLMTIHHILNDKKLPFASGDVTLNKDMVYYYISNVTCSLMYYFAYFTKDELCTALKTTSGIIKKYYSVTEQ